MTNEDKQYEIEKDEKQKIECDWLLQRLVQNNNTQEYSTQITLYVGGKLISGEMISYRQYFEKAQGETIEPGPGKNSEYHPATPHYIHLENAIFHGIVNSGIFPGEGSGVLWRGRLSEVQGFILGSIEQKTISKKVDNTISISVT